VKLFYLNWKIFVSPGLATVRVFDFCLLDSTALEVLDTCIHAICMFVIVSYSNDRCVLAGSVTVDNVLCVLLSTGMFVGGIIGFSLDNIIPGLISSLTLFFGNSIYWMH
jgi:hypothetical protein